MPSFVFLMMTHCGSFFCYYFYFETVGRDVIGHESKVSMETTLIEFLRLTFSTSGLTFNLCQHYYED